MVCICHECIHICERVVLFLNAENGNMKIWQCNNLSPHLVFIGINIEQPINHEQF